MDILKAEIARKKALSQALKAHEAQGPAKAQQAFGVDGRGNGASSSSIGSGNGSSNNAPKFFRQRDRQDFELRQLQGEQTRLEAEREARGKRGRSSEGKGQEGAATDKESHSKISNKDSNSNNSISSNKDVKAISNIKDSDSNSNNSIKKRKESDESQQQARKIAHCLSTSTSAREAEGGVTEALGEAEGEEVEEMEDENVQVVRSSDEEEKEEGEKAQGGKALPFYKQEKVDGYDPLRPFHLLPHLPTEGVVYFFFKSLLRQWEKDLQAQELRTAREKAEKRSLSLCKQHIKPLFHMLKRQSLSAEMLSKLRDMAVFCEQGDFRAASDLYIKTAIGNSAWPIGLTMVGIHERSGRERISTAKVAHIMNNELERKYLTAVKRLMTFAQDKRPDVAPSMKVL